MTKNENAPRVLLCVSGGIAAYKAVEVLRLLQKSGCDVRVACTEDSLQFVGAATWEGLTHRRLAHTLYDAPDSTIAHIEMATWADVVLVAPATANIMAKMACGLADNMVSATLLAVPGQTPVVVAPAMNTNMWLSQATRNNVRVLSERGVHLVTPEVGHLACDAVGEGKLAQVEDIAAAVLAVLGHQNDSMTNNEPEQSNLSLSGKTVLITAGPTHEAIDPVRYIANASSGKMGYAIAREALQRDAHVILVSGPVSIEPPDGAEVVDVVSAAQMYDAAVSAFERADVAICAAAVADYTPACPADHKLKKNKEDLESIALVKTKDILAKLSGCKDEGRHRVVVGFAAETNDLVSNAQAKLCKKGCDLVVANDVSRKDSGFGSDTNRVTLVFKDGVDKLPTLSKQDVAVRILDTVSSML